MANLGSFSVDIRAGIAKLQSDLGKSQQMFRQHSQQVTQEVGKIQTTVNRAAGAVAGLFAVGAMARTARELVRVADGYQNIQGKLRLVTQSQEQLGRVTAEVFGISQRTFASMDSTATLVARTTRALVSNGAAQDEALQKSLRMSGAISNAFLVSGSTAQESTNAIIQLSQGLAAGALRGEEFNSIAEQGPRILQALGEYLGKSTGELRAFAKEGGITAEVIQGALLGSFQRL